MGHQTCSEPASEILNITTCAIIAKLDLVPNDVADLKNKKFQKKHDHIQRKILKRYTEIYLKILFLAKVTGEKLKFSDRLCRKKAKNGYPKFLRSKNSY